MTEKNAKSNWLLGDHLGSTSMVADASGTKVSEMRYSAFGETRYENGSMTTDYLYTGQRQEAEIGLYYYVARWYDPAIGRFIQADSVVPDPGSALGYDRFAYVANNSLNYTDSSGHIPEYECGFHYSGCGTGGYTPDERNDNSHVEQLADLDEEIRWLRRGLTSEEILLMSWQDPLGSDSLQGGFFGDKRKNTLYGTVFHMSIDVGGDKGAPIFPGAIGRVVYINNEEDRDLGVSVTIEHNIYGEKFYSVYGHMVVDSVTHLSEGLIVDMSTQIGEMGQTGTDNVHLHFEIRKPKNLNLDQGNPLKSFNYWGFTASDWNTDFVDLGQIYGYHPDYTGMP